MFVSQQKASDVEKPLAQVLYSFVHSIWKDQCLQWYFSTLCICFQHFASDVYFNAISLTKKKLCLASKVQVKLFSSWTVPVPWWEVCPLYEQSAAVCHTKPADEGLSSCRTGARPKAHQLGLVAGWKGNLLPCLGMEKRSRYQVPWACLGCCVAWKSHKRGNNEFV